MNVRSFSELCAAGASVIAFTLTTNGAFATVVPITLTKLSGLTGGTPAATAVYRADLSSVGLTTILSLQISDNSGGLGGSPGQFSGFDLDAIKLSNVNCANATCAAGAGDLGVFDFTGGTLFSAGSQRAPADAKLFGTGPAGNTVDNAVARLGAFDGNSTTALPPASPSADGFVSLGDSGQVAFNLTSPISPSGVFLYIGEVGDNGEVAASNIVVKDTPTIPEPTSMVLIAVGLGALFLAPARRRRNVK